MQGFAGYVADAGARPCAGEVKSSPDRPHKPGIVDGVHGDPTHAARISEK